MERKCLHVNTIDGGSERLFQQEVADLLGVIAKSEKPVRLLRHSPGREPTVVMKVAVLSNEFPGNEDSESAWVAKDGCGARVLFFETGVTIIVESPHEWAIQVDRWH